MFLQFWSAWTLQKDVLNQQSSGFSVYQKKKDSSTRRSWSTHGHNKSPPLIVQSRFQVNSVCTLAVLKGTSAWISCVSENFHRLVNLSNGKLIFVSEGQLYSPLCSFTGQEIHSMIVALSVYVYSSTVFLQTSPSMLRYECTTIKILSKSPVSTESKFNLYIYYHNWSW